MQDLRQLPVWQKAYQPGLRIDALTGAFPKPEQSSLTSRMQRAAVAQIFDLLYRLFAPGRGRGGPQRRVRRGVCRFQIRDTIGRDLLCRRSRSGKQENRNGTSTGPVLPAFLFSRFSLPLPVSKRQVHLYAPSAAVPASFTPRLGFHLELAEVLDFLSRPDHRATPDLLIEVERMPASLIDKLSPDRRQLKAGG